MTNNKQQTEINAVEYLDKVNQFAKENNTDKPRQQTAIEWFGIEIGKLFAQYHARKISIIEFHLKRFELEDQAKEMQKDQHIKSWEAGLMKVDFNEYYEQTYGGVNQ